MYSDRTGLPFRSRLPIVRPEYLWRPCSFIPPMPYISGKEALYMITIRAYAKLNLYLQITGSRVDGYHDLDMIMQSIDLHDTLRLSRAGDIQLTCSHPEVPLGQSNIAHKAARALFPRNRHCRRGTCRYPKTHPHGGRSGRRKRRRRGHAAGAQLSLWLFPFSERRLLALARASGRMFPFP